jgi:hypothetical protein
LISYKAPVQYLGLYCLLVWCVELLERIIHTIAKNTRAWAEARRTDLPKLYPRMESDNPDVPADPIMPRPNFPDTEYKTNANAVEAAKGLLNGPDKRATRLWWNPAKQY